LKRYALLERLRGGDRRSIGRANAVARAVVRHPQALPELAAGLWHADPVVRVRAADALEKVSREEPTWLTPLRAELLTLAAETTEPELRWHLAQMLSRTGLSGSRRTRLVRILKRYLRDRSAIVRVAAVQGLVDLSPRAGLRPFVRRELDRMLTAGTPAERARARMLLAAGTA
jgi:HEAT repeat protein